MTYALKNLSSIQFKLVLLHEQAFIETDEWRYSFSNYVRRNCYVTVFSIAALIFSPILLFTRWCLPVLFHVPAAKFIFTNTVFESPNL